MQVKFMKAKLSEDQFRQIGMDVAELFLRSGLVKSKSDARRQIEQRSLKIDNALIFDPFARVVLDNDTFIILEHDHE